MCKKYGSHFLGIRSLTRSLQSTPFQIPESLYGQIYNERYQHRGIFGGNSFTQNNPNVHIFFSFSRFSFHFVILLFVYLIFSVYFFTPLRRHVGCNMHLSCCHKFVSSPLNRRFLALTFTA